MFFHTFRDQGGPYYFETRGAQPGLSTRENVGILKKYSNFPKKETGKGIFPLTGEYRFSSHITSDLLKIRLGP